MFDEIKTELKVLKKQLFTGHVRFGIEHGIIMSMAVTTKIDTREEKLNLEDYENLLVKFSGNEESFYGSLDYNLKFGEVINFNWSVNLQGEQLRERLRTNQCRSVKVVVKKSDG